MKFQINLLGKTLYTYMREAGYAPSFSKSNSELVFQRPGSNTYPKFHVYATENSGTATLNLHLDQKKSSYKGSHAHSAEYDGRLIETEANRIISHVRGVER